MEFEQIPKMLEDASYVMVDYESEYSGKNKLKYMGYIARLSCGLYNDNNRFSRIHLVIIYTADVNRGQMDPDLNIGTSVSVVAECTGLPLEKVQRLAAAT